MHEYYDVEEYHKYLAVQAQAALFIFCYHGYLSAQSLWQTVLAFVVVAWLTDEITSVGAMAAGLVGLALGVACVRLLRLNNDQLHYNQVFHFLIQPAVLYYTLPLYVEQTMYPVGMPLSLLLWLAMNMIMWAFVTHDNRFYAAVGVPVVSMFVFSWLLDKYVWVPLGVTAGVTVLFVAAMLHMRYAEKLSREK